MHVTPMVGRPFALSNTGSSRRDFLRTAAASCVSLALPGIAAAAVRRLEKPVRIGAISDLHQDIMHDAVPRMRAFVNDMAARRPDAIVQLGDFAYPNERNKQTIDLFNQAHEVSLHVIGNHDTDAGHTQQQCFDVWGMPSRYYARQIAGLWLVVLDGNDRGSPTHRGGYPSYVGEEQRQWLREQLSRLEGPAIVISHQPLAGPSAVDNAEQMQAILGDAADKVILALSGHSHVDEVLRVKNVAYMHLNSASYFWVGGKHKHESYSKAIHAEHPWISHTCPYRDPLFATLTVDPETLTIDVEGRSSEWVGESPADLGVELRPPLAAGEQVAPHIRDRRIARP